MYDTSASGYGSSRGYGERALWIAVLEQAIDDIYHEPMKSREYTDAVAFFSHGGKWFRARCELADVLLLHPDDLTRIGRKAIVARRSIEGLPAEEPPPVPKPRPPSQPTPPARSTLIARPCRKQPHRGGHEPRTYHPFDPFRPLPSEQHRVA